MDGGGDFRVGGESSNFIKFDASTGVLTVDGTINIIGGATSEAIAGLQATVTSSNAQSQSAADVDFASSGSQVVASSSLGTKINPYETQVVLDSGGMALKKDDGTLLADYGETY